MLPSLTMLSLPKPRSPLCGIWQLQSHLAFLRSLEQRWTSPSLLSMSHWVVWIQQFVTGQMALSARWLTRRSIEQSSERALQVAVKSTQSQEIHLESPEGAAKELGLRGRPAGDLPQGPGCPGWSVQGRRLSSGDWTFQNTKHDLSVISKLLQCFPKSEWFKGKNGSPSVTLGNLS